MDALDRLRRANPVPDPSRPSWDALAARLDVEASRPALPRRSARGPRTLLVAVLLLLLLAAGAVAAGTLLWGEPVPEPTLRPTPGRGTGIAPRSGVQLLPLTAPDPDGGPPWGMRLVRTTRGLACLQLGRRSGGQLGLVGRDGAFRDDGRFHPISARAPASSDCVLPDAPADPVIAMVFNRMPASGSRYGCQPRVPSPRRMFVPCPPGSERDVYVGVLGREARSVTYRHRGRLVTRATVGRHGAYLIVLPSARRGPISITGPGAGPDRGLVSVQYSGGRRCLIISHRTGGGRPCSIGRAQPVAPVGAGSSPHATIQARVRPSASVQRVEVRFRAPAAIRDARSVYLVTLPLPAARVCDAPGVRGGDPAAYGSDPRTGRATAYVATDRNFAAGARVRLRVLVPRACRGIARGRVDLKRLQGPNPDPVVGPEAPGRFVGRFSVRLGRDG